MDTYRESYLKKKEQMSGQATAKLVDVGGALESANSSRSTSPRASSVTRRNSTVEGDSAAAASSASAAPQSGKKLVFRSELDEHKKQVSENTHGKVEAAKNELFAEISAIKDQLQAINVKFESTKTDHLKTVLNETIKQLNENTVQVTQELATHSKSIDTLHARVLELENLVS